ncbi:MAG: AbrB/MazE/SpoVT family DNA-binding domain-containing protein [Solirubrobacteraceae bacterium]|nr:AbrB/MazE/SpoVT family DNA-binding domain-containing protein [Solirubrobacteraceae bacterium]
MAPKHRQHPLTLSKHGRIVIPAAIRRELGMREGDRLAIRVDRGRLVLVPDRANVESLRGMLRDLAPEGGVVEELLAERREQARREDAG